MITIKIIIFISFLFLEKQKTNKESGANLVQWSVAIPLNACYDMDKEKATDGNEK